MRAAVFDRYGPPEVLRVADLPAPRPGPGQVRVTVRAAAVQPFDTMARRGAAGVPVTFPQQLGNEFSGIIHATSASSGDDPNAWAVGDEVIGFTWMNALAEQVVVDQDVLVAKPPAMTWDTAGAIFASGTTALTALRELRIGAGDTLLVHAAAGGAGTMTVQLARHLGARVIGTASPANHTYLTGLGAIPVAYGDGLVERVRAVTPAGVDAALDAVGGGQPLRDSLALVPERYRVGTLVDFDLAHQLGARAIRAQRSRDNLEQLVHLHTAGALQITIRARYPLEEIAHAHREVERGHGRGKVIVTPIPATVAA